MEQKDYKKLLRKIQLNANMLNDQSCFAGWVYSMIATELDENSHWKHMSTDLLDEFNKEIAQELLRRRGGIEDKKKQEPTQQLPKTRKSLKGVKIYPPAPTVMEMVNARVAKELEGFSDAFKVRDKTRKAKKAPAKKKAKKVIHLQKDKKGNLWPLKTKKKPKK